MNAFERINDFFREAARAMDLSPRLERLLLTPRREVRVRAAIERDDGQVATFLGCRVQHDNARGPMRGGLRFHPDASLDELRGLAALASIQAALVNVPFGGAAGGVACEPTQLSPRELERLTRRYVDGIREIIGPRRDVLAPDVHTGPQVMAWVMDQFARYEGHAPAVATGKPVELDGLPHADAAAARGLCLLVGEALKEQGKSIAGATFVVQGLGHVGGNVARLVHAAGGQVVAAGDSRGGIHVQEGLDVPALLAHKARAGTVSDFPSADRVSNDVLLATPCDVLVPAALGGAITAADAKSVRAEIVAEGAFSPLDPDGDRILRDRGITVLPDLLANAGGAIAGYVEWERNLQAVAGPAEGLDAEIEHRLLAAYRTAREVARERSIPLRTAAFVVGIARVAKAMTLRGL